MVGMIEKENDINVDLIQGGMSVDDDMRCFGDYYDTIYRMYKILLEKGCKEPFTIISDKNTKECSGTGNNMRFIAIDYDVKVNCIDLYDLPNIEGMIKEVCVNERDYIMSRPWIKEWVIVDGDILGKYDGDYRLMLTDGNIGIITGCLTIV